MVKANSSQMRDWVYANLDELEKKYSNRSIMVIRTRKFLFFKGWKIELFDSDIDAMKKKIELYQNGSIGLEDAIIINFRKTT
ncbi:MAG: hypothetical protein ACXAEU_19885 [Candidatus Hodarchaeales archaeon]